MSISRRLDKADTFKQNEITSFAATRMDLQIIIQRERQASRAIIYMSNVERIIQRDLLTKQKESHKQKINACSPKGKGGGRGIK